VELKSAIMEMFEELIIPWLQGMKIEMHEFGSALE